ncbi:hypothetical protein BDV59DRAFT_205659 [Aspergillus ambiguus]|uniref:uncharacterized protein n=1 Tax=Aspergillus ambiguus TaxID=176160 RepID=UPI003CCD8986
MDCAFTGVLDLVPFAGAVLTENKMTSLYPGRESPDPETQSDEQKAPLASGKTAAEFRERSKSMAEKGPKNLESNPKHPLEDIEARKFSKGTGN